MDFDTAHPDKAAVKCFAFASPVFHHENYAWTQRIISYSYILNLCMKNIGQGDQTNILIPENIKNARLMAFS